MSALDLTRNGLIRALGAAIAARIAEAGVEARVVRRAHGDYAVEATGPGLFAREFGSLDAPAEPVVGAAVEAESRAPLSSRTHRGTQ